MAGRILVLDDEENYAAMLQDLLRENNYRVDMATRPERAIDQLEEIPYDLVISDYKMPVMDGADFLKKSRELYPNLPFILVSGLMNTPELVKVANMSVTQVMEKPLDTATFLKQVARFAEPMTEEEKSLQAQEEAEESVSGAGGATFGYPEEPRFFSAVSPAAKRFMQSAWSIAKNSHELFVFQTPGGDAELAVKDLSAWSGNSDLPVTNFDLPAGKEEALVELRAIFSDPEQSNTVCIRLAEVAQLGEARELSESVAQEAENTADLLLSFVLESNEAESHSSEAGDRAVLLPELNERPSDLASYARRFARMASERSGKGNCSGFTPEAAYLVLAHDWPRGYKELQKAMLKAVKSSENDEAISAELMRDALGLEKAPLASPDSRLATLMRKAQKYYFEKEMLRTGTTAAELAAKLDLGNPVQTWDDLRNMPLVRSELAKL